MGIRGPGLPIWPTPWGGLHSSSSPLPSHASPPFGVAGHSLRSSSQFHTHGAICNVSSTIQCSRSIRNPQGGWVVGDNGLSVVPLVSQGEVGSRLVLGKFSLAQSEAIFAGPETRQSGPPRNFWDWDRDHQGPSISVWSWSRPSPDLDQHIYSVFFVI